MDALYAHRVNPWTLIMALASSPAPPLDPSSAAIAALNAELMAHYEQYTDLSWAAPVLSRLDDWNMPTLKYRNVSNMPIVVVGGDSSMPILVPGPVEPQEHPHHQ